MSSEPTVIQRVLFVTNDVHVYGIPPLSSNKGFNAASWTSPIRPSAQQIFTARLRVVESSVDAKLSINILLEDGKSGELFAGAPYTASAVVQQALDSSRFFAVRVQGEGGMKATLGIGFEDRSPALDFVLALTDARKLLGIDQPIAQQIGGLPAAKANPVANTQQDYSLKEGEKIHIQLGSRGKQQSQTNQPANNTSNEAALFSIAPPPGVNPNSAVLPSKPLEMSNDVKTAQDYGFDDGEFGEFQ